MFWGFVEFWAFVWFPIILYFLLKFWRKIYIKNFYQLQAIGLYVQATKKTNKEFKIKALKLGGKIVIINLIVLAFIGWFTSNFPIISIFGFKIHSWVYFLALLAMRFSSIPLGKFLHKYNVFK